MRAIQYDVLGEQKGVNLTAAGKDFSTGKALASGVVTKTRRWTTVETAYHFLPGCFFFFLQTSIRLAACEMPSLSLRPKFSHETVQIAQRGWRGQVAHLRSVGEQG